MTFVLGTHPQTFSLSPSGEGVLGVAPSPDGAFTAVWTTRYLHVCSTSSSIESISRIDLRSMGDVDGLALVLWRPTPFIDPVANNREHRIVLVSRTQLMVVAFTELMERKSSWVRWLLGEEDAEEDERDPYRRPLAFEMVLRGSITAAAGAQFTAATSCRSGLVVGRDDGIIALLSWDGDVKFEVPFWEVLPHAETAGPAGAGHVHVTHLTGVDNFVTAACSTGGVYAFLVSLLPAAMARSAATGDSTLPVVCVVVPSALGCATPACASLASFSHAGDAVPGSSGPRVLFVALGREDGRVELFVLRKSIITAPHHARAEGTLLPRWRAALATVVMPPLLSLLLQHDEAAVGSSRQQQQLAPRSKHAHEGPQSPSSVAVVTAVSVAWRPLVGLGGAQDDAAGLFHNYDMASASSSSSSSNSDGAVDPRLCDDDEDDGGEYEGDPPAVLAVLLSVAAPSSGGSGATISDHVCLWDIARDTWSSVGRRVIDMDADDTRNRSGTVEGGGVTLRHIAHLPTPAPSTINSSSSGSTVAERSNSSAAAAAAAATGSCSNNRLAWTALGSSLLMSIGMDRTLESGYGGSGGAVRGQLQLALGRSHAGDREDDGEHPKPQQRSVHLARLQLADVPFGSPRSASHNLSEAGAFLLTSDGILQLRAGSARQVQLGSARHLRGGKATPQQSSRSQVEFETASSGPQPRLLLDKDAPLRWAPVPGSQHFVPANAPLRCATSTSDGLFVAVAGERGVSTYDARKGAWHVFSTPRQEQGVVAAAMAWLGNRALLVLHLVEGGQVEGGSGTNERLVAQRNNGGAASPTSSQQQQQQQPPPHGALFELQAYSRTRLDTHSKLGSCVLSLPIGSRPLAMSTGSSTVQLQHTATVVSDAAAVASTTAASAAVSGPASSQSADLRRRGVSNPPSLSGMTPSAHPSEPDSSSSSAPPLPPSAVVHWAAIAFQRGEHGGLDIALVRLALSSSSSFDEGSMASVPTASSSRGAKAGAAAKATTGRSRQSKPRQMRVTIGSSAAEQVHEGTSIYCTTMDSLLLSEPAPPSNAAPTSPAAAPAALFSPALCSPSESGHAFSRLSNVAGAVSSGEVGMSMSLLGVDNGGSASATASSSSSSSSSSLASSAFEMPPPPRVPQVRRFALDRDGAAVVAVDALDASIAISTSVTAGSAIANAGISSSPPASAVQLSTLRSSDALPPAAAAATTAAAASAPASPAHAGSSSSGSGGAGVLAAISFSHVVTLSVPLSSSDNAHVRYNSGGGGVEQHRQRRSSLSAAAATLLASMSVIGAHFNFTTTSGGSGCHSGETSISSSISTPATDASAAATAGATTAAAESVSEDAWLQLAPQLLLTTSTGRVFVLDAGSRTIHPLILSRGLFDTSSAVAFASVLPASTWAGSHSVSIAILATPSSSFVYTPAFTTLPRPPLVLRAPLQGSTGGSFTPAKSFAVASPRPGELTQQQQLLGSLVRCRQLQLGGSVIGSSGSGSPSVDAVSVLGVLTRHHFGAVVVASALETTLPTLAASAAAASATAPLAAADEARTPSSTPRALALTHLQHMRPLPPGIRLVPTLHLLLKAALLQAMFAGAADEDGDPLAVPTAIAAAAVASNSPLVHVALRQLLHDAVLDEGEAKGGAGGGGGTSTSRRGAASAQLQQQRIQAMLARVRAHTAAAASSNAMSTPFGFTTVRGSRSLSLKPQAHETSGGAQSSSSSARHHTTVDGPAASSAVAAVRAAEFVARAGGSAAAAAGALELELNDGLSANLGAAVSPGVSNLLRALTEALRVYLLKKKYPLEAVFGPAIAAEHSAADTTAAAALADSSPTAARSSFAAAPFSPTPNSAHSSSFWSLSRRSIAGGGGAGEQADADWSSSAPYSPSLKGGLARPLRGLCSPYLECVLALLRRVDLCLDIVSAVGRTIEEEHLPLLFPAAGHPRALFREALRHARRASGSVSSTPLHNSTSLRYLRTAASLMLIMQEYAWRKHVIGAVAAASSSSSTALGRGKSSNGTAGNSSSNAGTPSASSAAAIRAIVNSNLADAVSLKVACGLPEDVAALLIGPMLSESTAAASKSAAQQPDQMPRSAKHQQSTVTPGGSGSGSIFAVPPQLISDILASVLVEDTAGAHSQTTSAGGATATHSLPLHRELTSIVDSTATYCSRLRAAAEEHIRAGPMGMGQHTHAHTSGGPVATRTGAGTGSLTSWATTAPASPGRSNSSSSSVIRSGSTDKVSSSQQPPLPSSEPSLSASPSSSRGGGGGFGIVSSLLGFLGLGGGGDSTRSGAEQAPLKQAAERENSDDADDMRLLGGRIDEPSDGSLLDDVRRDPVLVALAQCNVPLLVGMRVRLHRKPSGAFGLVLAPINHSLVVRGGGRPSGGVVDVDIDTTSLAAPPRQPMQPRSTRSAAATSRGGGGATGPHDDEESATVRAALSDLLEQQQAWLGAQTMDAVVCVGGLSAPLTSEVEVSDAAAAESIVAGSSARRVPVTLAIGDILTRRDASALTGLTFEEAVASLGSAPRASVIECVRIVDVPVLELLGQLLVARTRAA